MIQAELLTETNERHFRRMLSSPDYGFQEKLNGHRLVVCKQDSQLQIFNREGQPSKKPLPHPIRKAFLEHPLDTFVVDGELVKRFFHVFDALALNEEILTKDIYEYREARYHTVFDSYSNCILAVKTARTPQQKQILWEYVVDTKGEGLVSKNMTKAYRQGRADQHWKLKFWKTADAVVIGPAPQEKDSVDIGMFDSRGRLQRISACGLRNKFRLKPGQVIEVRFLYATENRHIVQPILMSVRSDKHPAMCQLSQLEPYINKNWIGVA